jgi:hypothetical protein
MTSLWLANCYFSGHGACNVTSFRRVSGGLYWWSLILKAFATDNIFRRTGEKIVLCAGSVVLNGPKCSIGSQLMEA